VIYFSVLFGRLRFSSADIVHAPSLHITGIVVVIIKNQQAADVIEKAIGTQ